MKTKLKWIVGTLAVLAGSVSIAASYPERPVTVVVPFPAGGTTDILARHVTQELSKVWNQPVIVENRGGASGTIGSAYVTRSKPDGYTLMITATHHIINPALQKEIVNYDTKKDFTSLNMIATVPSVLVVNKAFEPKNIQELIELAKKEPGKINFGSTGIGGANHLAGELFAHMADIKLTHIPYRGGAPALNDLLANQIPMMFDSIPAVVSHIKSGNLRALGVTTLERAPSLPDVPTIDEAGVKGFEAISMFGMYGPANLPADIINSISKTVNDVLASDELKDKFDNLGAIPGKMSQPEFAQYVNDEIDKWQQVVEAANIKLEQ